MRVILKICYIYYISLKNKLKYNKIKCNVFISSMYLFLERNLGRIIYEKKSY